MVNRINRMSFADITILVYYFLCSSVPELDGEHPLNNIGRGIGDEGTEKTFKQFIRVVIYTSSLGTTWVLQG